MYLQIISNEKREAILQISCYSPSMISWTMILEELTILWGQKVAKRQMVQGMHSLIKKYIFLVTGSYGHFKK